MEQQLYAGLRSWYGYTVGDPKSRMCTNIEMLKPLPIHILRLHVSARKLCLCS